MTDSVAVFSPGDRLTDNATAAEMSEIGRAHV